ncbi:MAG: OmpA family protein [Bacteroidales bacterium]|nr:OmpA family protein [Bacteroidales bacterium]
MKKTVLIAAVLALFTSCVSTKKYNTLLDETKRTKQELRECIRENSEYGLSVENYKYEHEQSMKDAQMLRQTQVGYVEKIDALSKENGELRKQLDAANLKVNEIISDKSEHLAELSDMLYNKEQELNAKEHKLDSLQLEFYDNQQQMKILKQQIAAKDMQLEKIHNSLKSALLGFENKGLTIENKNGKVYVLLEEKLLFASGSWEVSAEGVKALQEIAVVLSNNKDIDIMVEGHTDNVPLKGKNQIKDNWDLSVMRATSITRILLDGTGISPKRIIPCGRSEYAPVVSNINAENRAKNRRSEIILSPKVNELMDILK